MFLETLGTMGANAAFKSASAPSGPTLSSATGQPITVGGINTQPGWMQLAVAATVGAALVWWAKH